ncbi:MAG: M28 family peptidase [Campylobacteraceae bacterium]
MKTPLEHFKNFSKTPRCSFNATPMFEYIVAFAKNLGFEVKTDKTKNILCTKNKPVLCLQSHYDMVCLGDAPEVDTYIEDGWLKAKNSTLGADNGMGIAIMFSMMEKFDNVECLFTSDEEVGLIGANNLELALNAPYLLNLDSEEEGAIIIGCAGGINIFGELALSKKTINKDWKTFEVSISGLAGGHSGIQIADNIPNAIKVLVRELVSNECEFIDFSGGEVSNSIPKSAKAKILAPKDFKVKNKALHVKELKDENREVLVETKQILGFMNSFAQGVRAFNKELGMPEDSINMGTVKIQNDKLIIDCFGRSMSEDGIERLKSETTSLLKGFGFSVTTKDRATPWKPVISEFTNIIKDVSIKYFKDVKVEGIHAGLECGIIQSKQKKHIDVASIGPNIKMRIRLKSAAKLNRWNVYLWLLKS